jgi:hypothetical protein
MWDGRLFFPKFELSEKPLFIPVLDGKIGPTQIGFAANWTTFMISSQNFRTALENQGRL